MTEKFELGRLVATPGAIEATTLRQHFNLVARHARFEARLATLRETRSARQPDTKPGLRKPFSLNPSGTLSRRHLAHFVSAVDTARFAVTNPDCEAS